jgi:hypothetical protein
MQAQHVYLYLLSSYPIATWAQYTQLHTSFSCLCSSCSNSCAPKDFNSSTQYRNLWELLRDYMDYVAVIQTSGISRNIGIVPSPWMLPSVAYILWPISTNCRWILKTKYYFIYEKHHAAECRGRVGRIWNIRDKNFSYPDLSYWEFTQSRNANYEILTQIR